MSRDVRIGDSYTMVEVSKDSVANLGELLIASDHHRPQLIGLQNCVVTGHARRNYQHLPVKTGFYLQCTVVQNQN